MFWLGDSREGLFENLKKLPSELRQGIQDNIPPCCVATYVIAILLSLVTKKDARVFELIYRDYNDFLRTDYWRCPFCKIRNKVNKVRWTSEAP